MTGQGSNPLGFTVDQVKAMLGSDLIGETIATRRTKIRTGLHIVVTGNPVDGFAFYGPFKTAEHANEEADEAFRHEEWWIAPLQALNDA